MVQLVALQTTLPQIDSNEEKQARALKLRQLAATGQADALDLQQKRQAMADDEASRAAYAANPTDAKARLAALAGVSPKAYGAEAKAQADQAKAGADTRKSQLETAKQQIDLAGQVFGFVRDNPTPENAMSAIQHLQRNGVFTPEQATEYAQQVQANPGAIRDLANQAFTGALSVKEQLMKIATRDAGGTVETIGTNPVTGQVRTLSSMAKTQTPDSVASITSRERESAADRAAAAARVATTEAGADRRSAAQIGAARDKVRTDAAKPLPAGALKMQQQELEAIGTASGINEQLTKVEGQIKDKKLDFGPISNLVSSGLNVAGISTEQSRNLASFRSTLERLRNESLRLNAGVQTDGDAQRAWNELFTNINDKELVKQRLKEIKGLNDRAVKLRRLNVDNIRANYGKEPLDTKPYQEAGAPPAKNARGWTLHEDAQGNKAYVSPDGKTFEEVQ